MHREMLSRSRSKPGLRVEVTVSKFIPDYNETNLTDKYTLLSPTELEFAEQRASKENQILIFKG